MMTMITLMTRSNVSPRSIGIGIGIEEKRAQCDYNAACCCCCCCCVIESTRAQASREVSFVDEDVWM